VQPPPGRSHGSPLLTSTVGPLVLHEFHDGVVRGIDDNAIRAAERFFLAAGHNGHLIAKLEAQGCTPVEREFALGSAGKHVDGDASGAGERIDFDLFEGLNPRREE
jgi:hypothetical protein